jgi:hypothetical protein
MSTSKPVGALEIDWSHPLARGLVHFALYEEDTLDLATGQLLVKGSSISFGRDGDKTYHKSAGYNDAGSYITLPDYDCSTWEGVSLIADTEVPTQASQTYPGLICSTIAEGYHGNFNLTVENSAVSGYNVKSRLGYSLDTAFVYTNTVEGSSDYTGVKWAFGSGDKLNIFTRRDVATNGPIELFTSKNDDVPVKRVERTSSSNFYGVAENNKIGYYHRQSTHRTYSGKVYKTIIFNRAISNEEMESLHDDPYQFLKPNAPYHYHSTQYSVQ